MLKVEAYFLISALRFSKKKLEASFDANTLKVLQFCLHLMVEVFSSQRTEEVRRKPKVLKGIQNIRPTKVLHMIYIFVTLSKRKFHFQKIKSFKEIDAYYSST